MVTYNDKWSFLTHFFPFFILSSTQRQQLLSFSHLFWSLTSIYPNNVLLSLVLENYVTSFYDQCRFSYLTLHLPLPFTSSHFSQTDLTPFSVLSGIPNPKPVKFWLFRGWASGLCLGSSRNQYYHSMCNNLDEGTNNSSENTDFESPGFHFFISIY
jgi:hypothetical protein